MSRQMSILRRFTSFAFEKKKKGFREKKVVYQWHDKLYRPPSKDW